MTTDEPRPPFFHRLLTHAVDVQLIACELLVVVLAMFVSLDALLRWLFNWSFLFVDELGGYALVTLAFLGMSVALHEGALFRVEAFYDRLPDKVREILQLFFDFVSLAFSLLLLWELYGLVGRSFAREIVAPTILRTPLWIPQTAMAVGALTLSLVLVLHVVAGVGRVRQRLRGRAEA